MSHVSVVSGAGAASDSSSRFRAVLRRVRATIEIHQVQARLRWEFDQCSDRELADMGVSRADIDGIVASYLSGRDHGPVPA